MKREKIYLGNTLIHDEKEYNEMKESINTLKTNLEGVTAPVTYTGSVYENNGHLTYNFYGDNPLRGNLKKLKPGDILQLFQLSESGEELSANTYTILNGSDNTLTGSEDYKAVLMLDNFNELLEIRTNYSIHKTSSETWYFTNSSDGKLVPQNPVNSSGVTIMNFNDVKPGDIFKVDDIDESFTTYWYVLTDGKGYYDATSSPIRAVTVMSTYGNISGIGTDGSIVSVSATKLNDRMSTTSTVIGVETIPVRNEQGTIDICHIKRNVNKFTFNGNGWYRVYSASNNSLTAQSIRLNINSVYDNMLNPSATNNSYTFEINLTQGGEVSINQFASIHSNLIDKIRIISTDSYDDTYIDIHYNISSSGEVDLYFTIDGIGDINLVQNPIIPDTHYVTEFTTVNGFKSQINNEVIIFDDVKDTIDKRVWNQGYKYLSVTGTAANITTEQFIQYLNSIGAFTYSSYFVVKGLWNYAHSDTIIDTGIGNIQLAGATVEVFNQLTDSYEIRISTASRTSNTSSKNSMFIYRYQDGGAETITSSWSKLVNSDELPLKGSTNRFTAWNAIPCETKIYSGGFQTDVTINCSKAMPVGESITLIMLNTTSSSHTINLTNFNVRNVDTITVKANKRAEINIMALNTDISDYHVRGINYED